MNSFEQLINERLWQFDFEVTKFDWLLVLIKYSDGTEYVFHNASADEIYQFLQEYNPILLAHNGKYYDQYILKAILAGFSIDEIKAVNDHIIDGGQGFEINYGYVEGLPPVWDTLQDIVPAKSLKEIEANLLLDITESTVDFDIDHAWTEEEYEDMLYYCRADVKALKPLFEARKTYFETKFDICILANLDPAFNVGLTNAKLCAKFLEAEKVERDDEREYQIPQTISVEKIDKRILNFFDRIHDDSIPSDELFTSKLEIDFHNMPCTFAWGGAHGALANFVYEISEDGFIIINADYASLYPHLLALAVYNFISRNIKDKNKYKNTLDTRLELKHQGKKKEQLGLKLILNTTYGCQNNKYNDLYDPKGARGTCITGQLLISELTEVIYALGDVELIQLNTDGIMVKLPKSKLDNYYKVCGEFSKKCQIELEYDIISKIIQRDVNNYIMIYGSKGKEKIKAKGGCFASLPDLKINEDGSVSSEYKPNFKANSLAIVSEALARNLLFGTPIEDTINNCDNIHMFQMVQHLGATYKKCVQESPNGDITLQRNNRIYAGKKPSGLIVKVKPNGRRDSLANCPPNPIVDNGNKCTINDINKQWYIKLAKQWANDFKGVRRLEDYKKDELLEKATGLGLEVDKKIKKVELIKLIADEIERRQVKDEQLINPWETEEEKNMEETKQARAKTVYEKINDLKQDIMKKDFTMDKAMPNNLGGGEYASIGQYYRAINELSVKYGLLFMWDVLEASDIEKELFKPQGRTPQHVVTVECSATFVDVETGDEVVYRTCASGSDICDKAVSGASTMAFRNWFDKNFAPKHLSDDMFGGDEEVVETSEQTAEPKIPTYIPPEKKAELAKEVVAEKQVVDSDSNDIQNVINKIMEVRELSGKADWGASTLQQLIGGEITSENLMEIELKVDNKLDSLRGE